MSKKSILLCFALLAAMLVGIGVAVAFLYSGTASSGKQSSVVADDSRYLLLPAVPSDAAAVFCFSKATKVFPGAFSQSIISAAGQERLVISLHHSGKELVPLYILDAGKASNGFSDEGKAVYQQAKQLGMYADTLSCADFADYGRSISSRSLVLASKHENLVKSSVRHLQSGESVMDAPGFADLSASLSADDFVFLSASHSQRLISTMMKRSYAGYSSFFSRFADWTAFAIQGDMHFTGLASKPEGPADFITVLNASEAEVSSLSRVLPSYTIFAASLPMRNVDAYLAAYEGFIDSRQQLASYHAKQKELSKAFGRSYEELLKIAGVKEVATASFKVAGEMQKINLMKLDKSALSTFCPDASGKDYVPALHEYAYPDFISSLFGKFFALKDESFCTYIDGWLISGSKKAIGDYIDNDALEYSLADKMNDSGNADLLAKDASVFVSYLSLSEDRDELSNIFSSSFIPYLSTLLDGSDYCPLLMKVVKGKRGVELKLDLYKETVKRTKAPVVERDTTVIIPEGPFMVKNSGTGKMNKFYQNSHLSICLSEDAKDLWGIPFQQKICGVAETIDYYANGKLQILFGAGSKMYLIDRLGRFVSGFPVDLGKDILIGPKPYDFNGVHKYNAIVLHKDNSLEMYNMKGQKPQAWKTIRPSETIKALPEKISVGNKSYWVVRTSLQTLIYPLMGGEPLTLYEGDKMIRPDSEIRVLDASTVEFECYDGDVRSLKF